MKIITRNFCDDIATSPTIPDKEEFVSAMLDMLQTAATNVVCDGDTCKIVPSVPEAFTPIESENIPGPVATESVEQCSTEICEPPTEQTDNLSELSEDVVAPTIDTVTESLSSLTFRELQTKAKSLGVSGKGSKIEVRDRIVQKMLT